MLTNKYLHGFVLCLGLVACGQSQSFNGANAASNLAKKAAEASGNSAPASDPPATIAADNAPATNQVSFAPADNVAALDPQVTVELPSNELRSGAKQILAQALVTNASDAAVSWSVSGPAGVADVGSIDESGIYTSPADASVDFKVVIKAVLKSKPDVSGSHDLQLVSDKTLFVGCKKGNSVFPIAGDIYSISAAAVPNRGSIAAMANFLKTRGDFSSLGAKLDTVCLDKYDIPDQSWTAGFPGSPSLVEWFLMHSTTWLNVPADGNYAFNLGGDDGAMLYIDGNIAVDNDGTHSFAWKSGVVHLTKGKHKLVLDWYQGPRDRLGVQLKWTVPGASEAIIPNSAFEAQ